MRGESVHLECLRRNLVELLGRDPHGVNLGHRVGRAQL